MRIGFALNSRWAIRLLNRFESGFSADAPTLLAFAAIPTHVMSTYILYHLTYKNLSLQRLDVLHSSSNSSSFIVSYLSDAAVPLLLTTVQCTRT